MAYDGGEKRGGRRFGKIDVKFIRSIWKLLNTM